VLTSMCLSVGTVALENIVMAVRSVLFDAQYQTLLKSDQPVMDILRVCQAGRHVCSRLTIA
jgi:hypothetical protein